MTDDELDELLARTNAKLIEQLDVDVEARLAEIHRRLDSGDLEAHLDPAP